MKLSSIYLSLLLLVTSVQTGLAQTPFLAHFAPSANEYAVVTDMAVDPQGNIFVAGIYTATIDADPGPSVTTLTSHGDADFFVLKLDAQGALMWAQSFGGIEEDACLDIGLDASGNIYCSGYLWGPADLDPGPGVHQVVGNGYQDVFVMSLNSAGDLRWGHAFGGIRSEEASAMAVDAAGNMAITGNFSDTVDFDPGIGQSVLISRGISDIFVAKFNSAGQFQWAGQMGGIYGDQGNGIAMDPWGSILTTGTFSHTADFDPSPSSNYNLTSPYTNYESDIFVSKLSPNGGFIWAKGMSSPDGNGGDYGIAIATDAAGNSYTVGQFDLVTDFDPDSLITQNVTAVSDEDAFILKLDSSGQFVWVSQLAGTDNELALDVLATPTGELYLGGYFDGDIDLDPGTGVVTASCGTNLNAFTLHLDAAGNYQSSSTISGTESLVFAVALDASEQPYYGGRFIGQADFDPSAGTNSLTSQGIMDAFLLARPTTTSTAEPTQSLELRSFPNPAHDQITITFADQAPRSPSQLSVYDMTGRLLHQQWVHGSTAMIDLQHFQSGIYQVHWQSGKRSGRVAFVKD